MKFECPFDNKPNGQCYDVCSCIGCKFFPLEGSEEPCTKCACINHLANECKRVHHDEIVVARSNW